MTTKDDLFLYRYGDNATYGKLLIRFTITILRTETHNVVDGS
jgi:hypothetical protein